MAHQLSAWGGDTGDEHVSDISDKLGVLLSEVGEIEEQFASGLEDSRVTLKNIRNTEASVQPSRDNKQKLIDQIGHLKVKEPTSPKLVEFEQALVRAEAENLVAEAQLTNIQRHALKETYLQHMAAIIERSEKSIILAEHGRRLLEFLDDTPVVPGDAPAAYMHERHAKQILLDCETELQSYRPKQYNAGQARLGSNLLPEEQYENESYSAGYGGQEAYTSAPLAPVGGGQTVRSAADMSFSEDQQHNRAPIARVSEGIEVDNRPRPATRSSFTHEDGHGTGAADRVQA